MTTKVKVTQEHLDAGKQFSCEECAVSLAIKEAFAKEKVIGCRASTRYVAIFFLKQTICCEFPPEVSKFIRKFDKGEQVEPFEFELIWEKK
jgi:hypothetical protein